MHSILVLAFFQLLARLLLLPEDGQGLLLKSYAPWRFGRAQRRVFLPGGADHVDYEVGPQGNEPGIPGARDCDPTPPRPIFRRLQGSDHRSPVQRRGDPGPPEPQHSNQLHRRLASL